MFLNI